MNSENNIILRKAKVCDLVKVYQLYLTAYRGTYPDASLNDFETLKLTLDSETKFFYVAEKEDDGQIVASLFIHFDEQNKLAKVSGAVVLGPFRGLKLTTKLMNYGIAKLQNMANGIDVIYVTTRTIHKAAQILFSKLGFKELGIFPNVHKTNDYETHALAAIYFKDSLTKRFQNFEQHPKVLPLYNIVKDVFDLPQMQIANIWTKKDFYGTVPDLEVIEAKKFIALRSKFLKENDSIDLAFFPFHTPNLIITSPDQRIEVFAYVNEIDKHCVITGCRIDREVSFTDLFLKVGDILRSRGIRYIEIILRANRLNIIDKIINAKYLPCAYVPAFQLLRESDLRYDYVVFSRSFEILDFNNIELSGTSEAYLKNYIKLWEETFLGNYFKK